MPPKSKNIRQNLVVNSRVDPESNGYGQTVGRVQRKKYGKGRKQTKETTKKDFF